MWSIETVDEVLIHFSLVRQNILCFSLPSSYSYLLLLSSPLLYRKDDISLPPVFQIPKSAVYLRNSSLLIPINHFYMKFRQNITSFLRASNEASPDLWFLTGWLFKLWQSKLNDFTTVVSSQFSSYQAPLTASQFELTYTEVSTWNRRVTTRSIWRILGKLREPFSIRMIGISRANGIYSSFLDEYMEVGRTY